MLAVLATKTSSCGNMAAALPVAVALVGVIEGSIGLGSVLLSAGVLVLAALVARTASFGDIVPAAGAVTAVVTLVGSTGPCVAFECWLPSPAFGASVPAPAKGLSPEAAGARVGCVFSRELDRVRPCDAFVADKRELGALRDERVDMSVAWKRETLDRGTLFWRLEVSKVL